MRLYYYTAKQWGMKALWEKRLKISTYDQLNDPFEMLPFALSDPETLRLSAGIKEFWSRKYGIVCLSSDWRSPLMWAHYGEKHQGLCLGFEISPDDRRLTKIKYISQRLKHPKALDTGEHWITNNLDTLLEYKHSGWKYEKEHRLQAPLGNAIDGIHYLPFYVALPLREVIIGASCSLKPEDIRPAIEGDVPEPVTIFKARMSPTAYKVCRNRESEAMRVPGWEEAAVKRKLLANKIANKDSP